MSIVQQVLVLKQKSRPWIFKQQKDEVHGLKKSPTIHQQLGVNRQTNNHKLF